MQHLHEHLWDQRLCIFPAPLYLRTLWRYTNGVIIIIIIIISVKSSQLIEQGLTSHETHYRSYRRWVFTDQMTQPTVSKH